jgi:hypothetical protein
MSMRSNGDQELLAPSEKMSWEHLRYPLSDFVLKKHEVVVLIVGEPIQEHGVSGSLGCQNMDI